MKIHDIIPRNLYLCSEFDEFALKTEDIDFSLEDLVSQVVQQSDVFYWLNVESVWGRMGFVWDDIQNGEGHFSTKTVPYSVIPKLPDGDRIHTFHRLFDYNTYDELTFLSSDWSNVGIHQNTYDFMWTTNANRITNLIFSLDYINLDWLSNKVIGFSQFLSIKNITDEQREQLRNKVLIFQNANNNTTTALQYSSRSEDILKLPSFFITVQTGLSEFYIKYNTLGDDNKWICLDDISTMDYWGIYNTNLYYSNILSGYAYCKFTLKPLYLPKTSYTSQVYTYPCIGGIDNRFLNSIACVIDLSTFNTYVPDFSPQRDCSVYRKFVNGFPKYLNYGFSKLEINVSSVTYMSLDDNLQTAELVLTEEDFNKYWKAHIDSIDYVANSNYNKYVIKINKTGELTEEDYLQIAKYQRQLFVKNISVANFYYDGIYYSYLFPYEIDMKDKIRFDMFYSYRATKFFENMNAISPVVLIVKLSNLNQNDLSRNILIFSNTTISYEYSLIAPISEDKVTVNVFSPEDITYYNIIAIDNSIKYKIDSNSYPTSSSNSTNWYIYLTDTVPEYTFDYSDYVVEINLQDLLDAPNRTSFIFQQLVFKDGVYNNDLVKFYENRDTLFQEVENIYNQKNDRVSINTLGDSPIRTAGDYHWGLKETYAPVILLNIDSTSCTAIVHDWCYIANTSIIFEYENNEFFDFDSFINALQQVSEDASREYTISMNTEFYKTFSAEKIAQITAKGYTVVEII